MYYYINGGLELGIDPGHGGKDPGAIGRVYGTEEDDYTYKCALKLLNYLYERIHNLKIHVTRGDEETKELKDRSKQINLLGIKYLISLHFNSNASTQPHGVQTFYYNAGKELAEYVQRKLALYTGLENRGVSFGNFHILREVKPNAILVEGAFISNKEEEEKIRSEIFQDLLVSAIGDGFIEYLVAKGELALEHPENIIPQPAEDDWGKVFIQNLKDKGIISSMHESNAPVTWGELAKVVDNSITYIISGRKPENNATK